MKFKVGDRVKIVKCDFVKMGEIGKIIDTDKTDDELPYLTDIEDGYWFREDQIELVEKLEEPTKPYLAVIIEGEAYTKEALKDAYETTEDDIQVTTNERDRLTNHLKTLRKWKKTLYSAMEMLA